MTHEKDETHIFSAACRHNTGVVAEYGFGRRIWGGGESKVVSEESFTLHINTNQKGDQELACIEKAIEMYKEMYPNAELDIDYGVDTSNWGDYSTRLLSQFASGEPVDIVWIAIEGIAYLASNGVIVPLDDYVAADEYLSDRVNNDIGEEVLKCMKYDGTLYGLPLGWNNTMIVYNTKMFEEQGITPNNDWTWDEFLEDCQKLTTTDANGEKVWGFGLNNQLSQYQAFLAGNNTYDMNEDWTESWWNKEETIETFQYIYDLINKYEVMPYTENAELYSYFTAGRFAMFMGGPWDISAFSDDNFTDYDFLPPPSKNGAKGASYGADGYCMTSACEHPQEALEFMKLLTSDEIESMIAELGTSTPATISAAYSDAYLNHSPNTKICYDSVLDPEVNARVISSPTFLPDIHTAFSNYWSQVLGGEITVEEMCNEMHETVEDLLQQ